MINSETETLILPKDICRMFPGRSGNGISLSTVWRWMLHGRRRQKLDSLIVGGTRYTSREAVQRFVAGLNGGQCGHATVIKYRKELESTGQIDQSTRRVGRDGRNIDTARIGNGNQNATGKLYQSTCRVGREGDDAPWVGSNIGFAAVWNAHHERCEHLKRFSEQRLSAADQFVQTAVDKTIDLFLGQVTQQIQDYAGTVCTPAVEKNGADPEFVAMLLVKALKENLDPLTIFAPTNREEK